MSFSPFLTFVALCAIIPMKVVAAGANVLRAYGYYQQQHTVLQGSKWGSVLFAIHHHRP
jgi:hypothetical protein